MQTKERVLIIVENLPVPFDRRVWMEATALQQAGYEVSVICPKDKGFTEDHEVLEGIHIYRHPLPPEQSSSLGYIREYLHALFWEFKLARRVWRERGFDLVHICNPPDLLFLVALWFKLLKGVRVIFDQHDLNPELYEAKYGRRDFFYTGLLLAERCTYAVADAVIATNDSYREVALHRGRKQPESVVIVKSGPDPNRFRPFPPNHMYRNDRTYLVGYVGIMGEQEGLDVLLRAIAYLVHEEHRSDIHFMLIGGGPALEGLRALSTDLGITHVTEFAGFVWGEELLERLSSCDLCVSPEPKTPYNNLSTMNKILEYMALGKPMVLFDLLEGMRSAGEAAVYVKENNIKEFATQIAQLLADEERRQQMGKAGLSRIRTTLAWQHQVPNLLAAYEYAARGRSVRSSRKTYPPQRS